MDNAKKSIVHDPSDDQPFLVIAQARVDFEDGERVFENTPSVLEADTVLPEVAGRLLIIPFELGVCHKYTE